MTNFPKKEEALRLRQQEMSYSQIKQAIGVSKSTLSGWLKDYPLSKERIDELRGKSERRIERYRETMRKKREKRLLDIYEKERDYILPLSEKEVFIFGLGLYWGEGSKTRNASLSVSNTDPSIVKFFIFWLNKTFGIPKQKLRINLQLYKDMDIKKELLFWENTLGLTRSQFNKPYIKESSVKAINHKGGFGHGTCNVAIGNIKLSEKILMAIKAISDEYSMRV